MQPTLNTYILLDRSGSMAGRWVETMGALNAYIDGLKAKNVATLITIAAFDAGQVIDFTVLRDKVSLYDFKPLNTEEITPRGGTPLFDAIGRIASLITGERVTLTIITDGAENSSKELTREGAKAVIERLQAKGYDVTYIGADFDAFNTAASVGIGQNYSLNMTAGNYAATMDCHSARAESYAMGSQAVAFSPDDRAVAIGNSAKA